MGPDVSKTFWKFGGLVARRNPLRREEFRSIAGGVSSAGNFPVRLIRQISGAVISCN